MQPIHCVDSLLAAVRAQALVCIGAIQIESTLGSVHLCVKFTCNATACSVLACELQAHCNFIFLFVLGIQGIPARKD